MKKIFALILAIVMMASMSVVAFAAANPAETSVDGVADSSDMGGTVLTYGVTQAYTVTIPADQTFSQNPSPAVDGSDAFIASAVVKASGVKIAGNEWFVVKVDSNNNWKLVEEHKATTKCTDVDYVATVDGEELADNGMAFYLASSTAPAGAATAAEGVAISFATAGTGQEGNYQDTLTFKVEITTTDPAPVQGA